MQIDDKFTFTQLNPQSFGFIANVGVYFRNHYNRYIYIFLFDFQEVQH